MQYRVGDYVLDLDRFELRRNGALLPAEPQVLSVLFFLVENRDRLVTKDELVGAVWGGRAVSDSAISSRIKSARQLLGDDGEAQRLIRTVHAKGFRFVGPVEPGEAGAESDHSQGDTEVARRPGLKLGILLSMAFATAALVIALLVWRPWADRSVTVAVRPANAAPQSDLFARDLTAKLAMLSTVDGGAMSLLERTNSEQPDLLFNIDASTEGSEVESNLVLMDGGSVLLWSKDFRQPQAKLSDLKQQLAYTAGKVLECALDTTAKGSPRLDRQVVKLYLSGCAASADLNENNIFDIERIFKRVVDAAPGFRRGWSRLLLAETATLDDYFDPTEADLRRARQTLEAAQKVDPAMPEIYVLQGELAPPTAMTERMRFVETAVRGAPEDGDIAMIHSYYLLKVGRVKDAAVEARRSVRNDPLSPAFREALIFALAYADRIPEAEHELREAEVLWPGAYTLREARFTLYLRFADPKEAVRLRNSGLPMSSGSPFLGSFLAARANPTPANVELALRDARALYARTPLAIAPFSQAMGAFHHEDELFGILLNWQHPDKVDQVTDVLFRPALRNFHHDPRFMQVAARLGILQYWLSTGKWPDFCFDSDLRYDCKRVGAQVLRASR